MWERRERVGCTGGVGPYELERAGLQQWHGRSCECGRLPLLCLVLAVVQRLQGKNTARHEGQQWQLQQQCRASC